MIAQAIQKIIEISNGELKEVEGRICSTRELHPVLEPEVHAVRTTTLNGLVDYIKGVSDFPRERVFLHVQHHNKVSLTTQVSGPFMQRQTFAVAEMEELHHFGQWMPVSEFIPYIQAAFEYTSDKENLIKVLGNLKDGTVRVYEDDGISNVVTTKVGVARVGDAVIKNPVRLAPYVTFPEISQPHLDFVFRMKGGDEPQCFLLMTRSQQWVLQTKINIGKWLKEEAGPEIPIIY